MTAAQRRHRPPPPDEAATLHRSGAVASMLRMPVATLRVWERRYALTNTALSPGGQRLYAAEDVRRLALLKQLSELGHAIGRLAPLSLAQLQRVAAGHARSLAAAQPPTRAAAAPAAQAWRLGVVGDALGARLRQPALLRQIGRPVELLGPFADLAQASAALAAASPADAWLLQLPQLQPGTLAAIAAALSPRASARRKPKTPVTLPVPVAVLYSYAADAVCEALAAGGVTLLREPQSDVALAQWLHRWAGTPAAPAATPARARAAGAPEPRGWDDAALAGFAAQSSTVACECPRHVAELLLQLSRFEAYSAQCEHRSPGDAELHAYLRQVAADGRVRFEAALEQVALREGLLLPAARSQPSPSTSAPERASSSRSRGGAKLRGTVIA
jgi:hypothetical protein